jgi:transcriptional regulator with XRE-family HTH domain
MPNLSPQERFAANLRKARAEAGISQEELASRCELHRTEISLLERAGREPRLATMVKLAGSLDTTVTALAEGIGWNPSRKRFDVKKAPAAAKGKAAKKKKK